VRLTQTKACEELLASPWSVRTRIYEYGGGAYTVGVGAIWFSNMADSRVYMLRDGEAPKPLTPPGSWRYGDLIYDGDRGRLIAVRESMTPPDQNEPSAELVSIDIRTGEVAVIFEGYDFFSSPRLSPDGKHLAWIGWNHPNMPWDDTSLMRASVEQNGTLTDVAVLCSVAPQARMQPGWSAEGELWYVSDANGWWNLCRWPAGAAEGIQVTTMQAEIGSAPWMLGYSNWAFVGQDRVAIVFTENGYWRCGVVDSRTGQILHQSDPWPLLGSLACIGSRIFVIGADQHGASGIYEYADGVLSTAVAMTEVYQCEGSSISVASSLTVPVSISEHTREKEVCYAWYYPPASLECEPLPHEAPPVVVQFHGGPTYASSCAFSLTRQFWTNRGFALIDVNYRGSTGYGREYRHRLYQMYGILDVEDAIAVVEHAAERGLVDASRAIITGASSGGYTTLAALAFHDCFAAGINQFGVGDLTLFQRTAHKFESHFLRSLVGDPFEERCRVRSPLSRLDAIRAPLITFQGSDDVIVPLAQSEAIFSALRSAEVPCAYVEFEGEGHGFRRHDTQVQVLEMSMAFVRAVLDLDATESLISPHIENRNNLSPSREEK
jgi:acetyl esterase/lipase